jgi:hypothetical protein
MKNFYELTEKQQKDAINYAYGEICANIELKLLVPVEELDEEQLKNLAECAAEGSYYTDDGKVVPFHALGGCT